jgi:peptide/nickel transport system substrate-binding protein
LDRKLNRRDFLRVSALAAAGVAVAACAKTAEPTQAPEATQAPTATQASDQPKEQATPTPVAAEAPKEAPMWVSQVEGGTLPALQERLPTDPMVLTPWDQIGTYGGTWHTALLGRADSAWISRTHASDRLLRWSPDLTEVIPNVAGGWEVQDGGKEFVFALRKGTKWSDGEPFTADDFVFWWENDQLNSEMNTRVTSWMRPGGEVGSIEKVDDATVSFKFAVPSGRFVALMAQSTPYVPAHYAEQFHIDFNKDAVEKATEEGQFQDWVAYYRTKTDFIDNPEMPVLFGWVVTTPIGSGVLYEVQRNPYCFKVDSEGNQLPYIDNILYPVAESVDVEVLKALNGEIDMQDRHIATPANKSVFVDNMEKGDYGFFTVKYAWESPCVIALNLSHKDPEQKKVYLEKDFRVALSHAINRQEIIDTLYVGDGKPAQPSPIEESPYYNEQMANQYLEYDPDTANQILDDLGLEKGANGMRNRFDGQPLFINIEVIAAFEPWAEIMEMVKSYWAAVGVDSGVKVIDRSLFYERKAAYDHDCMVWTGADGIACIMDPRWYMPYSAESIFGVAWADWWNSEGDLGEEPPEAAKQQQELFDQLNAEADPEKQAVLFNQILDIGTEQYWCIGTTRYYKGYGIVKNNFKNVPAEVWQWHLSNSPAQTYPEQYYIEA